LKILIIDDSNAFTFMFNSMLSELGLTCDSAKDGLEAISLMNKTEYDFIFFDWVMPMMNGKEFLKFQYENDFSKSELVLMSSQVNDEILKYVNNYGVSNILTKPFSIDHLQSCLRYSKQAA